MLITVTGPIGLILGCLQPESFSCQKAGNCHHSPADRLRGARVGRWPDWPADLSARSPTDDYDVNRLINLGTNGWAIKPVVATMVPLHPTWLFKVEAVAWLFGDNDNFPDETREQEPVISIEAHLIKRIRPGFWMSLDANYYTGGETRIGADFRDDLQRNARAVFTLVFPIKQHHAIRTALSTGISTRSGCDFGMYLLTWVYAWGRSVPSRS